MLSAVQAKEALKSVLIYVLVFMASKDFFRDAEQMGPKAPPSQLVPPLAFPQAMSSLTLPQNAPCKWATCRNGVKLSKLG